MEKIKVSRFLWTTVYVPEIITLVDIDQVIQTV